MSRNSYNRVNMPRSCSRSHGGGGGGGGTSCSIRGFRINPRRLSVKRLRARFASLFQVLSRCRFPCGRALKLLRSGCFFCRSRSGSGIKRSSSNGSQRNLVVAAHVKAKPAPGGRTTAPSCGATPGPTRSTPRPSRTASSSSSGPRSPWTRAGTGPSYLIFLGSSSHELFLSSSDES
ncbi:hypothetical protein NL676_006520 [Syzygium grande]|nr:hypothetical protein NL676_006520 [Syzygium grande]